MMADVLHEKGAASAAPFLSIELQEAVSRGFA